MNDELAGAERRVYMPEPVSLAAHRSKRFI